jgi:D-glycero-alpha-D-manno-heptose-7-phosphate kinase
MLITRTPNRISLLGGGTDHRNSFEKHGGLCLSGSIDKHSFLSVRRLPPFHQHKSRLVYSKIETVCDNADIEHRAISACIHYLGLEQVGLEIFHASDLPGRSGTGSSSTFVVGLLNALAGLQRRLMLPHELAAAAIEIEQGGEWLAESVGCQDQVAAAHGGLNIIRFRKDGDISVSPFVMDTNHVLDLEEHLLLFFTGIQRTSSEVASSYVASLGDREREQWEMLALAEEGIGAIYSRNYEKLGDLIGRSWELKARLSDKVVTQDISRMYVAARLAGAWGGKITGAGGGGMMLLVAPVEKRKRVIDILTKEGCLHIPFRFEFAGSTIIYSDKDSLIAG